MGKIVCGYGADVGMVMGVVSLKNKQIFVMND
jgi:hypothetical protein